MRPADIAEANRRKMAETGSLSQAIQHLHDAIAEMSDASHKSRLAAALNTLTTVQEQCHKQYGGSGGAGGEYEA